MLKDFFFYFILNLTPVLCAQKQCSLVEGRRYTTGSKRYILIAHCDLKNVYNNNKMNNVIKEFNFILNYNEKNERTMR